MISLSSQNTFSHDRQTVGEMLTHLRKAEGLTQAEVAASMGVSQSRISQIENDGPATIDQLCSYMQALKISWRISKWIDPINPDESKRTMQSPKTAKGLLYRPR